MMICISRQAAPRLREEQDFKSFKIRFDGAAPHPGELREMLAGIATLDESGDAWVLQSAVVALAKADDGWERSVRAMLESVRRFGWVRDEDQTVRAHVELAGA